MTRKPATYEDLLKLPDDKIGEIVDGELYASPRPAGRHASCAFTLSAEIGPPFQARRGGPGGWLFMFEPELHLADDTLVPDLAGWRRERLLLEEARQIHLASSHPHHLDAPRSLTVEDEVAAHRHAAWPGSSRSARAGPDSLSRVLTAVWSFARSACDPPP